ncbi:bifunctional adenosylcobinamide kinase/adenosylcobinamide-phosphate guanylyltransferase [Rhodobacteraceae bacterium W635]|uniref:bifunctional adenosylcobinamide kinase/adenosylcobinamide-phosphate guanylyltransferase n=1 Tax=Nioella halotolerans TaxID=2303578 RepID=UPI000E3D26AE|nr:bifunctional adenosylcobinamide kinase/adenosylcobinamide-phosphate guanylyltransferase [Rhodobacteraceae bacterium W635]
MTLPPLTLVIGGAASGKSAHAEALVCNQPGDRVYIASAEAHDDEMRAKIDAHQAKRAGDGWRTVEAPLDVVGAVAALREGEVALFDCATFWLSNLLLAARDWQVEADRLLASLSSARAPVVVVSNETGQGIVPENKLARRFRQAQGEVNQRLAAEAGLVIAVMAGLPLVLKGVRP